MVELMYSAGLRLSELLNLTIDDLFFETKIGYLRNGKGGKDRIFILADLLIKKLYDYIYCFCSKFIRA